MVSILLAILYPQGDEQHADAVMQALNNAVVEAGSSMIGGKENEDALNVLTELLAQEVIDPNVGDEELWSRVRLIRYMVAIRQDDPMHRLSKRECV